MPAHRPSVPAGLASFGPKHRLRARHRQQNGVFRARLYRGARKRCGRARVLADRQVCPYRHRQGEPHRTQKGGRAVYTAADGGAEGRPLLLRRRLVLCREGAQVPRGHPFGGLPPSLCRMADLRRSRRQLAPVRLHLHDLRRGRQLSRHRAARTLGDVFFPRWRAEVGRGMPRTSRPQSREAEKVPHRPQDGGYRRPGCIQGLLCARSQTREKGGGARFDLPRSRHGVHQRGDQA